MKAWAVLGLFLWAAGTGDLQAATKVRLRVESTPPGALVSVSSPDEKPGAQAVTVAGVTPLEKTFAFPKQGRLTLTLEKRGHAPRQVEVVPGSGPVHAALEKLAPDGQEQIPEQALPRSGALLLVPPEIEVIKRGFSSEGADPQASRAAEASLQGAVQALFASGWRVTPVALTPERREPLESLWRDARTAMQLTDPIRLPYLSRPAYLETSSSRRAAAVLGGGEPGTYLLLLTGKQVRDTAGMKLGQLAVASLGTACSYGSGYARAMQHGDSFFVYSVSTPDFTSGLTLKAVLIDASTAEVLWVNRGSWNAIRFDQPEAVSQVALELLAGLLGQGGR